ncbi:hypothetical protein B0H11DRAFT_2204803 [Mycena galericulata]|nr:hypothetical protein B0H11DRAFT_2204803 [Mycena galericulata]
MLEIVFTYVACQVVAVGTATIALKLSFLHKISGGGFPDGGEQDGGCVELREVKEGLFGHESCQGARPKPARKPHQSSGCVRHFLFSTTKSNPRRPRFLGTTWMVDCAHLPSLLQDFTFMHSVVRVGSGLKARAWVGSDRAWA